MKMNRITNVVASVALFVAAPLNAQDELGKRASWTPASAEQARAAIDQWLAETPVSEEVQLTVDTLWPAEGGPAEEHVLDQVAITIAAVDKSTVDLVTLCRGESGVAVAPQFEFLKDEKTPAFIRDNLRLYYGRWLARHDLYDEALDQLDGLQPGDVVDPAALLFYQGVVHHRLLDKEKCLPALTTLLENENAIPQRYATLAQLMTADLQPLKPDSLDEIARLMDDIYRRQRLYRSGTRVLQREDDVLAKLDKIIKELEEQQKKGGGPPGNSTQPSSPLPDSQAAGGSGSGEAAPRRIGEGGDWGKLPPKEREAAMAELAKDLPAHYREVIEEYFRKLARDEPR